MMTCASTRSVGRVGPSVTLAPGITPAQWRHTQRRSPEPSQTVQEPF